jgi:hypothetical protein
MTPFQIFLVVVLASGMVAVVICLSKGLIGRLAATCAAAVCAAGIAFAIEPNWTTSIAHRLGISRGTDLLLYLLVLTVLYGFLLIYLKLRRVRRELTLLVREIAIREAERKSPAPQQPPDSAQ